MPGITAEIASNEVRLVTAVVRSDSLLDFTRVVPVAAGQLQEPVGPSACLQGGGYVSQPNPVLPGGIAIDPSQPQDLVETSAFNLGETLFLRLEDSDQNVDFAVVDTATVTLTEPASGDSESIRLTETGPDTGVFAGYAQTAGGPAVPGDCLLQVASGSDIRVDYVDPADAADASSASAILDPAGRVFDSRTGFPVDGATVTLVDAISGQAATVFGNDGTSTYPNAVVSGAGVTDSGGTFYAFGPGEYRFPVVPSGDYRLVVTPPADYAAPSGVPIAELQLLPDAPYALGPASFGNPFAYPGDGPFTFDYPLDPQSTSLFLSKSTTTTIAAPGDFVRYEIVVENTAPLDPANTVTVVDSLPVELRYVPGSARVDDVVAADPVIDPATNALEFILGDLAAGRRIRLAYVAEIVAGQREQDITNTALARSAAGLVSNEASAQIRLSEELFRSTSTLIGRVVEGDCSLDTFAEDRGVRGVRVYLEDGRYAISDEGGRFHFEGLPPGTHVAQMDPATIPDGFEVRPCATAGRFAGRGDSQFVELAHGALIRADFHLQRQATPEGKVDIELSNSGNGNAEEVVYELTLRGHGNIPISELEAVVLLPDGVAYVPGTARADDGSSPAPRSIGQSLTFGLGSREGNWQTRIRFTGAIVDAVTGELRARALARFDSPAENGQQTPIAEALMVREGAISKNEGYVLHLTFETLSAQLSADDRAELDRLIADWDGVREIRISAVGHSDARPIAPANRQLFADNYALSRARALAAANYIAGALAVPAENIQVEGRGPDDPVAGNDDAEGRRQNRRVEMVMSGRRPARQAFLRVEQASSGTLVAKTKGLLPGTGASIAELEHERRMTEHLAPPAQVELHVNSLRQGIAWVTPQEDFRPSIPALKIAISHRPDQSLHLLVNGSPVGPANFDGRDVNTAGTVAISRYAGVDLVEGPNRIVAEVVGRDGQVVERLERSVHFAGPAVRAELLESESILLADGRTRPVFAVRFFDRFGEPARHSTVGTFAVEAPYRSRWQVEHDRMNKLATIGSNEPLYTIGRDGIAYMELEPTSQSGLATLAFDFEGRRRQELRGYLKADAREWVLVGFGEGTVGYKTLRDNQVAAIAAGNEDGYYDEGRLAFFAKGSIKGEYLLTLAYDSDRDREAARDRFQTNVDPDEYYTLYADNTEQRFEAPSQRKLYVKLERNQFMALFGDFSTGLSATELTRYERRFNGFKSEFRGRNVDYTVFASETDQSFLRDEIQGDGTSGLYRLSGAPLVVNSETIRIEVRDRFDPAVVLASQTLHRFLDYNLDPFDGALFFKKPVPSRDQDFNLVYIVAEYESRSGSNEDLIAGGRVALGTGSDSVELGLTYIDEGQQGAEADLAGVDFRWWLTDATVVRAEAAQSSRATTTGQDEGEAQALSVDHRSDGIDVRAYYRRVETGYGLGQQSTAEKGISKYGLDGRYALNENLTLNARASQQENLDTGAERTVAEAELLYRDDVYTATLGVAHAADEFTGGVKNESDLLTAGISSRVLDNQLVVRANGNLGLGDDPANPDYLSKYVVGVDYEVVSGVEVFAEYEDAEGRDIDTEMTRLGVRASPWHRARFTSSLNNETSEFGPRLFANYGLTQGFQVNEQWVVDIGLDQARTLTGTDLRSFDDDREFASGSRREDYVAGSLGTLYQSETWSINTRVEYRQSDSEERTTLVSGWYREPTLGHGLSAGLTLMKSDQAGSMESTTADLRFGWAWRVADSRWSFLDRIDLVFEDSAASAASRRSWRLINNFNANRRMGAATQLSLQYAFKYVRSEFGSDAYTGYTDLTGLDFARGFAQRWEAGLHASVYHAWESGVVDYGAGLDLGFNLRDNVWITLGYNVAGFHDDDFAAARYTAAGPYLRIAVKADQETLRRVAGR
ncbi:MAG: OmpA family protein [Gammaproteobacteria bacterium]|nr:OmpA family protein [Gammaproteobacteria bacterium]MDH4252961.1 OmpA family protein [Gammaproteobacteria bacterium]MDH5308353.1 OmpA family protein [Gammaproteobacteria bacterium]